MQETQVIIVGAGPIGLELAVALKHFGVDYLQMDAGQIGQTVSWYPRQARFFSSPERIAIAGLPLQTVDQAKATREEYLAYLRGVVEHFDLQVRTFERVIDLKRADDGFVVRTRRGDQEQAFAAKQIVLAIGDMHAPRRLQIPGEDLDHVSHYFDEPHTFFRKRLLIVGGRNSAVEAAIRCHRAGASVTMSYRQPDFDESSIKYWLLPEIRSLIKHGEVTFHPCTAPERITSGAVTLGPSRSERCAGEPQQRDRLEVEADFVLLLTGYVQDHTLFDLAGVERVGENGAPRFDPETMQTNAEGVYVAGTAAAGTQHHFRLFIENCHPHVTRIVKAITGKEPPPGLVNPAAGKLGLPES